MNVAAATAACGGAGASAAIVSRCERRKRNEPRTRVAWIELGIQTNTKTEFTPRGAHRCANCYAPTDIRTYMHAYRLRLAADAAYVTVDRARSVARRRTVCASARWIADEMAARRCR